VEIKACLGLKMHNFNGKIVKIAIGCGYVSRLYTSISWDSLPLNYYRSLMDEALIALPLDPHVKTTIIKS